MLRFNKVSEYGVLALSFIGGRDKASSAREISEGLHIPYEITAKTLQRLKEAGFVESTKGTHGGYRLLNRLSEISFAQVVDAIEGTVSVVDCATGSSDICSRSGLCGIQNGMHKVNQRVR